MSGVRRVGLTVVGHVAMPVLVAVVLAVVLAGCGAGEPTTVGTTAPAMVALASGGPAGSVQGSLVAVDDVGAAERVPVDTATLAVVPVGEVDALWDAVEFVPDGQQLATVGGLVGADVLADAILVEVRDGRFAVDPDDGDYVVCLLDGTGPWSLRGCADAWVDGPATWSASHGEGGFSLSVT